ncbi:hypothetical protein T492DRAFT_884364 [Pavlovales sp. CCMP2436]|nr:hypothetical protein T492DRAFT_884364 [Pavlovales sp. CCMP2436]
MGPLRAVVLAALAALCLAAPTATSPAAAASLEKTVGVREDGSTPDDPTVAADDALDHDNKVERVDLPDFAHSDPCNPNLDLDAHSVSHHGSGLAEANAWTPPPPSIVCPPPSPPPPPLNTLVVDIVAQSVDPGTCAMPASLESFMLDGKWTPGMDEAGSACFFDATWHERDGHTCKVERNVSACAPSVPNSVSGFEETGTGAAGKFGIEAGVRDTCVYAGKFVRCWGSNEADKLAVFSCYLHAKPGAPAGTVSAGEMGRFVYNRMRKTRYGARFKTDDLSEYTAFSFANNESAIQIDLSNVHACMQR